MALAAYNFIIKYRAGKMNPADTLLRRPLDTGGLLERRHHATINPKDFGNVGLLTQSKYSIRCTVQGSKPSTKILFLWLYANNLIEVRLV